MVSESILIGSTGLSRTVFTWEMLLTYQSGMMGRYSLALPQVPWEGKGGNGMI
jgi:hypothetical protein